jgi:hypothetical protein
MMLGVLACSPRCVDQSVKRVAVIVTIADTIRVYFKLDRGNAHS